MILSAVAPIFGIFFQSELNPNFRGQLSISSADAPFLEDFFLEECCSFSNSVRYKYGRFSYNLPNHFYREKDFIDLQQEKTDLTETEKLLENTQELIGDFGVKRDNSLKKKPRGGRDDKIGEIIPKVESMSLKDKKSSSKSDKGSKGYGQKGDYKETNNKKKGSVKKPKY